tara:strand:- start:5403 stop:5555 length:153 start_codon:yes stop_codon:yes gene_type:complete
MRKTKNTGTPFNVWLGLLPDGLNKKVKFLILRDFYEDGLTPEEVAIKVGF